MRGEGKHETPPGESPDRENPFFFFSGKTLTARWVFPIFLSFSLRFLPDPFIMSTNLTKRDIVLKIYDDPSNRISQRDVKAVVQQTLDAIGEAIGEGRNVELRNFGVFQIQVRKARVGRNPNRPETDVMIPTRAVIKFKAGKEMKEKLKDLNLDEIESRSD